MRPVSLSSTSSCLSDRRIEEKRRRRTLLIPYAKGPGTSGYRSSICRLPRPELMFMILFICPLRSRGSSADVRTAGVTGVSQLTPRPSNAEELSEEDIPELMSKLVRRLFPILSSSPAPNLNGSAPVRPALSLIRATRPRKHLPALLRSTSTLPPPSSATLPAAACLSAQLCGNWEEETRLELCSVSEVAYYLLDVVQWRICMASVDADHERPRSLGYLTG